MQDQLAEMQNKYVRMFDRRQKSANKAVVDRLKSSLAERLTADILSDIDQNEIQRTSVSLLQAFHDDDSKRKSCKTSPPDDVIADSSGAEQLSSVRHLSEMLKEEITSSLGTLVDDIVKNLVGKHLQFQMNFTVAKDCVPPNDKLNGVFHEISKQQEPVNVSTKHTTLPNYMGIARSSDLQPSLLSPEWNSPMYNDLQNCTSSAYFPFQKNSESPFNNYTNPLYNYDGIHWGFNRSKTHVPLFGVHPLIAQSVNTLRDFPREPEQTEPLPLVVSVTKKKRTKVTDTRLSPRAAKAILQDCTSSIRHQRSNSDEKHYQSRYGSYSFPVHQQQASEWELAAKQMASPFHPRYYPIPYSPGVQKSDDFHEICAKLSVISKRQDGAASYQPQQQQQHQQQPHSSSQRKKKRSSFSFMDRTRTPKSDDNNQSNKMTWEADYDGHGMISF